jgi:hypothetical protein
MTGIEIVQDQGATLAYLIRHDTSSRTTEFFTSDDDTFQGGFVVYPSGGQVQAHIHLPIKREVVGTSELLMVRSGRCYVDIYSDDHRLVATLELEAGDGVLSLRGGHGFRMIEDTVLFELKQGPFVGPAEKERFATSSDGEPL